MTHSIRVATVEDLSALWEMLTYAATMAGPVAAAQADPFLKKYVEGWGRPGDIGVLAVDGSGSAVGAAWVRLLEHSYYARNYAAAYIPELAIGVRPEWRGRGVGSALLAQLITEVTGHYPALVLSVRRSNPAVHLYQRLGFVTVEEIANRVGTPSVVMELILEGNER